MMQNPKYPFLKVINASSPFAAKAVKAIREDVESV
jgi:hypothetical protein